MHSHRSHEGWVFIDNRNGPGITDAQAIAAGLPVGAGKGLYESATYTCSHCDAVVVMNPKRTRERGYCKGCDRHLCDACTALKALNFECKTMAQVMFETQVLADKQATPTPSILLAP